MNGGRFIRTQNVERYRSLLERATGEADREKLLLLRLAEVTQLADACRREPLALPGSFSQLLILLGQRTGRLHRSARLDADQ